MIGVIAIIRTQQKAQEKKPPTPAAIEKALRVLTTRYRVTLEPLNKSPANDDEAPKPKEIFL
jgi:hypothetical protein